MNRMTSKSIFYLNQPDICLPIETPDTKIGWTEKIVSNLTSTRNRTISFNCQGELISNFRRCLAIEIKTAVSKDKKAETYLDEKYKLNNAEWITQLKCSGKRERFPSKCSEVMVGDSAIEDIEAVMNKIDSLTREMSMVPNFVLLPTTIEGTMGARHHLSPALVITVKIFYHCSMMIGRSTHHCMLTSRYCSTSPVLACLAVLPHS